MSDIKIIPDQANNIGLASIYYPPPLVVSGLSSDVVFDKYIDHLQIEFNDQNIKKPTQNRLVGRVAQYLEFKDGRFTIKHENNDQVVFFRNVSIGAEGFSFDLKTDAIESSDLILNDEFVNEKHLEIQSLYSHLHTKFSSFESISLNPYREHHTIPFIRLSLEIPDFKEEFFQEINPLTNFLSDKMTKVEKIKSNVIPHLKFSWAIDVPDERDVFLSSINYLNALSPVRDIEIIPRTKGKNDYQIQIRGLSIEYLLEFVKLLQKT